MNIQQKPIEPDITALELDGRLVLGSEGMSVRRAIDGLLDRGEKKIVMDMTKVEYVDSAGIGILVSAVAKTNDASGAFRLAGTREEIVKIFRITNVLQLLKLDDSVDAAIAALRQ